MPAPLDSENSGSGEAQSENADACSQEQGGEEGSGSGNSLGTLTSTALFGGIPPSRTRRDPCDE